MSRSGLPVDAFEAFLAGQRELADLDVEAAIRKLPTPPGLRLQDSNHLANDTLRLVLDDEAIRAEQDVLRRTQPSLPVMPRPVPAPMPAVGFAPPAAPTQVVTPMPPRRGALRWTLAGVAAAAVLVLGVGLTQATRLHRAPATTELQSASQLAELQTVNHAFRSSSPERRGHIRRSVPRLDAPDSRPVVPKQAAPLQTGPLPDAAAGRASPPAERLSRLETQAREQLERGDLSGARRSFRRLARSSGRSSRADLAYGELFALARRSGNGREQAKLWREYLRRFPHGRFADDARAGMCRNSGSKRSTACWEDYLRDFPTGSHRERARRELGSKEPG